MVQRFLQLRYLLFVFPATLLATPFLFELIIILFVGSFLYKSFKTKNFNWAKNELFLILIFFSFYLLVNFIVNFDNNPSVGRTFGFMRFVILSFAIVYFLLEYKKYFNKCLKYWIGILIIVIVDTYIQFITGKNILGYPSWLNNEIYRLSSFLNDEYKIAAFLFPFGLLAIGFLLEKSINIFFVFSFYSLLFFIVFLTGERSNFYLFMISSFILFFLSKIEIKYKIVYCLILLLNLLILNLFFTKNFNRQFNIINSILIEKNLIINKVNNKKENYNRNKDKQINDNAFFRTQYASHYVTAYLIFKNNILFGTGIKTFRYICSKEKYSHKLTQNERRCSTHPHNIILEFLSELGIIGFLIISYFVLRVIILSFKVFKNNFSSVFLSAFLFFLFSFFPFLPKGSFFTNWNAAIFWFFFGLILFFLNKKSEEKKN